MEWSQCDISEEVLCDEMARASVSIARSNRLQLKSASCGLVSDDRTPLATQSLHHVAALEVTALSDGNAVFELTDGADPSSIGLLAPIPVTAILHNQQANASCAAALAPFASVDKDKPAFNADLPFTAKLDTDCR